MNTQFFLRSLPPLDIPAPVVQVLDVLLDAGGRPYIVGGAVRSMVSKHLSMPQSRKPGDWDVECFGLSPQAVHDTLAAHWELYEVGARFGVTIVYIWEGKVRHEIQVAIPRLDSRVGAGHKDFITTLVPNMDIAKAAARRDFAFNGMSYDHATRTYHDPHGGVPMLAAGLIGHIGPQFNEDMPIRGWRAVKFAGRMNLTATEALVALMREQAERLFDVDSISNVWKELYDWAAYSIAPSRGIDLLWRSGWLKEIPILWMMVGCPQEPEWHPEGSVFSHTQYVMDAAADIAVREELSANETALLVMAALLHDCGKRQCTVEERGRIRSPGHDVVGAEMAFEWLMLLMGKDANPTFAKQVSVLIREHMVHLNGASMRNARRLAERLGRDGLTIKLLACLIEADYSGRPPLEGGLPDEMAAMLNYAEQAHVIDSRPQPLLLGRHLIAELGMTPGPHFKVLLDAAYEAQLDGIFGSEYGAVQWARRNKSIFQI